MEKMLTPEAVAEQLQLHPYTVRKMLREGQINGAFQVGRRWRVPESALKAFVAKRQAAASSDLEERGE
jgi:excisionase family DNA binding protein